jgi:hypothetical protein
MREFKKEVEDSDNKDATEYLLPVTEMYPDLTPEEQQEAAFYLTRYFEIIHSIFTEKHGLTGSDLNATFKREK